LSGDLKHEDTKDTKVGSGPLCVLCVFVVIFLANVSPSFAAIGHVTNDRLASGIQPGGSALYAALTAARLGCDARVLTSFGEDFVGGDLLAEAGLAVEAIPAARTTTFEHVYEGGRRRTRLLATAASLERPAQADVVLVCPVAGEVAPTALAGKLLGAGLQGWLRRVEPDGTVRPRPLGDPSFLAPCHAVFCSAEDLGDDAPRATLALVATVPIVVVTRGAAGADVILDGQTHHVMAHPADLVDPTGAGDVFAAAFLVDLARGRDPLAAARHAARCAAVAVEGTGPSSLTRLADRLE
jgi:1D-myo-inositol 3-kinase